MRVWGRRRRDLLVLGGLSAVLLAASVAPTPASTSRRFNPSMAVGSGSVISTAHDLNRFYTALTGGELLDQERLDEMTTTTPTPAPALGVRCGLGLGEIPLSCGGSYFGHFGELLGYRTWVGVIQDGTRNVAVYVTSDGGEGTQDAMRTLVDQELCQPAS